MTSERGIVFQEEAFVLHGVPWKETSMIVEVFTVHHGRVPLVAKGVRRPRSALRGLLQPFQPLTINWFGHGELRTLRTAEWQGGIPLLQGHALFCGFYLNELLVLLLKRDDPHEALFFEYRQALKKLAHTEPFEPVLRMFELALLRELGYAPSLEREAMSGEPVDPERMYRFDPENGAVQWTGSAGQDVVKFKGKTLLDMAKSNYDDPGTLVQGKQLMRILLSHQLGHQDLHSRRIIQELLLS